MPRKCSKCWMKFDRNIKLKQCSCSWVEKSESLSKSFVEIHNQLTTKDKLCIISFLSYMDYESSMMKAKSPINIMIDAAVGIKQQSYSEMYLDYLEWYYEWDVPQYMKDIVSQTLPTK